MSLKIQNIQVNFTLDTEPFKVSLQRVQEIMAESQTAPGQLDPEPWQNRIGFNNPRERVWLRHPRYLNLYSKNEYSKYPQDPGNPFPIRDPRKP